MPHVQITKDGEQPTITSPELSAGVCKYQERLIRETIARNDPEHEQHRRLAEMLDLGWVQVGTHVLRAVEIVKEAE